MPSDKTTHCPNCGVEIDVNELLYHELEIKAKSEMSAQINAERKKLAEIKVGDGGIEQVSGSRTP